MWSSVTVGTHADTEIINEEGDTFGRTPSGQVRRVGGGGQGGQHSHFVAED